MAFYDRAFVRRLYRQQNDKRFRLVIQLPGRHMHYKEGKFAIVVIIG